MKHDTSIPDVIRVQDETDIAWDDAADVVVVGFGGAGAAAAVQARQSGASVLIVDRFGGGGATHFSGGVFYAGATRFQQESGYEDTPQAMFDYLSAEGSVVAPDTLRRFCESSSDDLEWVDGFGVPHGSHVYEPKTAFPPDGYWIYYSGNEKHPAYAAKAKPAPRGHRVKVNGFGGHIHFARLKDAALGLGARFLPHHPVTRLVQDATGRVIGVEVNALPEEAAERHEKEYKVISPWRPFNNGRALKAIDRAVAIEQANPGRKYLRAGGGVILCAGGFVFNVEMMGAARAILKKSFSHLLPLGSMGDDGSGIRLGQSVGGVPKYMENVCVARTLAPPSCFANGIIVNKAGERFVNEAAYAVNVGGALLDQPDGKAWLILEAADFWKGLKDSFFPGKGNFLLWGAPALMNIFLGGTRRARSIEALCRKIGANSERTERTIAEHNERARAGEADPFGKVQELVLPIRKGPLFAVNMSIDNRFAPAQSFTMGGLDLEETTGHVRRSDGGAILGLFAAGRTGVGLCSGGYVSGLSIADTVFGGRRAGRAAASVDHQNQK